MAYDLNWDRILPRILGAGFLDVIDAELFGIFYRIGSKWNLAIYLSEKEINKEILKKLKEDIVASFYELSKEKVAAKEITLHLYPSGVKVSSSSSISAMSEMVMPSRWSLATSSSFCRTFS